jgi:hypothetical protein
MVVRTTLFGRVDGPIVSEVEGGAHLPMRGPPMWLALCPVAMQIIVASQRFPFPLLPPGMVHSLGEWPTSRPYTIS